MAGKHSILKEKSVQIPSYISSDENVTGIHPERRQMLLPKMLRSQRLLRRTLNQAPARLCAGITASLKATRWQYTPTLISHFPVVTAVTKTQKGLRHSSYLFPSLSWRQAWCNGPQKSNLLTKVLRDGNQTEIPPHLYPNRAKVWRFIV